MRTTLIDKINRFESSADNSVKAFNALFTDTPLTDLAEHLEVEIGELADTDTTRFLTVGNLTIKHNFVQVKELIMFTDDGTFKRSDWTGNGYFRDNKRSKWG